MPDSILRRRTTQTQPTTQRVDPRYLTGGTLTLTPQSAPQTTAPAPQPTVATPGGTPVNTTPAAPTQPNTNRNVAQTLTTHQAAAQPAVPAYQPTSYQVDPTMAADRIRAAGGVEEGEPFRRENIQAAQLAMDAMTQAQSEEDRMRAHQMYQLALQGLGGSPELQLGSQQLMQYAGGQLPPELLMAMNLASSQAGQMPPEFAMGSQLAMDRAQTGGITPELARASELAMGSAGQIPEALQRGESAALQNALGGGFLGPEYLERQQAAIRDRGALAFQDSLQRLAEEQARRGVSGSSFGDLDRARLEQSAQLGTQQQLTEFETQARLANQQAQEAAIQQLLGFGIAGGEAQRAGIGQLAGIGAQREATERSLLSDLLGYGTAGAGIQGQQISQLASLGGLGEEIRSRNLSDLLGYGQQQQAQEVSLWDQLAQIYGGTERAPTDLSILAEDIRRGRRKVPGI